MRREASRNKEAKAQWNLYVPLTVYHLPYLRRKVGKKEGPAWGCSSRPHLSAAGWEGALPQREMDLEDFPLLNSNASPLPAGLAAS